MAQVVFFGFLTAAAVLWLSVFGYVAALAAVAAARRSSPRVRAPAAPLPAVAVVVPVRNEESFISAKLADLRRADYPAERLTVVVVDGGSTDATVALVETERARGAGVELLHVADARGKADQLNAVFAQLQQEIIVVTDADAALDPACIRELVGVLVADPATAIVGARIRPATRLLEERMHWWLLNSLWWLEGEALGAGAVSGVCYAMRRPASIPLLPADCTAEDIRFALMASAAGHGVRLCRRAAATELRVPQTVREFLRFRRRRGTAYVRELLRARATVAPRHWHVMRLLRLYHFLVMPVLAAAVGAIALALCVTPHWQASVATAALFATPALVALFASTTLGGEGRRWWRLSLAAGRLAGLTWLALLALPRAASAPLPQED